MKRLKTIYGFCVLLFLASVGTLYSLSPLWAPTLTEDFVSGTNLPPSMDLRSSVQIPILMYHGITEDANKTGEYWITSSMLEDDLRWLKEQGYTTVSLDQLIAYTENSASLPAKPILLTFDDGYCNNLTLALPILKKHEAKAVFSIIGAETLNEKHEAVNHSVNCHLTIDELTQLSQTGLIEIQNHSYNLHVLSGPDGRKGADRLPGESPEAYGLVLTEDLNRTQALVQDATGTRPVAFTWPFGARPLDDSGNPFLKDMGFKVTLTSYQKMNTIERGNPESLFNLKRFLRTPDFLLEDHLNPS